MNGVVGRVVEIDLCDLLGMGAERKGRSQQLVFYRAVEGTGNCIS